MNVQFLALAASICALAGGCRVASDNREICRRFIEEVYGARRLEVVGELVARDAVVSVRAEAERVLAAQPDLRVEVLGAAAQGEHVAVHWRSRATDPHLRRPVEHEGIWLFRVQEGRIVAASDLAGRVGALRDLAQKLLGTSPGRRPPIAQPR
jgi:hypothetical protein